MIYLYYIQANQTALHLAAINGHTATIEVLLEAGADKDANNSVSTF